MILINLRAAQLRYYADHNFYTNAIGNLDITYTAPKYFYSVTSYQNDPNLGLGLVLRNNEDYGLYIYVNSTIMCSDNGGSGWKCSDIGMTSTGIPLP